MYSSKKTISENRAKEGTATLQRKPITVPALIDNRPASVAQRKIAGTATSVSSNLTSQLMAKVIQLGGGDMYYWVISRNHGNQYVGKFKSHAAANDWWKKNKSGYQGYTFGRGSSDTSYR